MDRHDQRNCIARNEKIFCPLATLAFRALLVSTDFHIPLFSRVYPGNQPDSVTFRSVTEERIERYRLLAMNLVHVTLVFDKGNNSEQNLEALVPSRYHVVGSFVPTQHQDLLEVPLDRFQSFEDTRLE